jgi:LuxR family maltose regulon positive regulatory protein
VVRLLLARQRGNLPAAAEEARRLQALTEAPDAVPAGLGEELRALALVNLGITEYWGGRLAEAEPHLEQGITLARKIGRPYLEFLGLAHSTSIASVRSSPYALAEGRARQTIELAQRHGWTDEPAIGIAYIALAAGGIWRRQLEEAADWVRRAEGTLRAEAEPMTAIAIRYIRALLELTRGRDQEVLATVEAAERLSRLLEAPDWPLMRARALRLHALVRLGEFGRAEQDIAEISEQGRVTGEIRMALAALRIAPDDPHAATVVLAPVLSGAIPVAPATGCRSPACWRRSPGTLWVTRPLPGTRFGVRSMRPRPMACWRPSCSIPRPGSCSIAIPRIGVTRPPWWPRSVACSPQKHPKDHPQNQR